MKLASSLALAAPSKRQSRFTGTVGNVSWQCLFGLCRLIALIDGFVTLLPAHVGLVAQTNEHHIERTELMTNNGTTPITADKTTDNEAILARFKAAYVNAEHGIVDAWLRPAGNDIFIEYQLDMDNMNLPPEDLLKLLCKITNEFEGLPTVLTWFARE